MMKLHYKKHHLFTLSFHSIISHSVFFGKNKKKITLYILWHLLDMYLFIECLLNVSYALGPILGAMITAVTIVT